MSAGVKRSEPFVESVPTASLVRNPRNPRKHPEAQLERLMASLRRDGQTKPLLARRANRMLIAGHGIHEAATRLGMAELLVRFLDVEQETADRIMLGDNRLSDLSRHDDTLLAELVREIEEADLLATGFSAEEAHKLFAKSGDAELEVREIATGTVEDVFWISVKGPLAQQAEVLQRLKQLLAEYPRLDIQLGMIESF